MKKLQHSLASLKAILGSEEADWNEIVYRGIEVQKQIALRTRESREKDYINEFRNMTFSNEKERNAVLGRLDENSFIKTH